MNDFEKWFEDQDFYANMRFIHGDKLFDKDGDIYRVLPVQMTYQGWSSQRQRSKDEFVELTQEWHTKGWNARQGEIDELKAQLNNMEACYIERKKRVDELEGQLNKHSECIENLVNQKADYLDRVTKAIAHLDSFDLSQAGMNKLQRSIESALEALRGES